MKNQKLLKIREVAEMLSVNPEKDVFVLNAARIQENNHPVGTFIVENYFEKIADSKGKGITDMVDIASDISEEIKEVRNEILFSTSITDFYELAQEYYQLQEKLKKKCDIVIALAHLTSQHIEELVSRVEGIDVVIGSHDYYQRSEVTKVGDAIMVQTGSKGQYLGDLKINFEKKKNIESYDGKIVQLTPAIKDHPAFNDFVSQFAKEYDNVIKNRNISRRKKNTVVKEN